VHLAAPIPAALEVHCSEEPAAIVADRVLPGSQDFLGNRVLAADRHQAPIESPGSLGGWGFLESQPAVARMAFHEYSSGIRAAARIRKDKRNRLGHFAGMCTREAAAGSGSARNLCHGMACKEHTVGTMDSVRDIRSLGRIAEPR